MTIPPFPSQDLAKLILGYLAEEQLMTTYDEFLQASPYLDVLKNEYDRIFMTSLKNILAEYRAVKIFVETCTPFSLRRKLFQCSNLLEVIKFLVENIDTNKIYAPDTNKNKISPDKDPPTVASKSKGCEQCHSVSLTSCICESCHLSVDALSTQNASISEITTLETSKVETTALSDLPGTHVTVRQKQIKFSEPDNTIPPHSQFNTIAEENSHNIISNQSCVLNNVSKQNISYSSKLNNVEENQAQNLPLKTTDLFDAKDKIEEFNDILNIVCNKNRQENKIITENSESKRISIAGTFQDFATGVSSCGESAPVDVPLTTIASNFNIHSSGPQYVQSGMNKDTSYNRHINTLKSEFRPKIYDENVPNLGSHQSNEPNVHSTNTLHLKKMKKEKITIISDVKVETSFNANNNTTNNQIKMPTVLKNATSTPLMQMQTILINGTPAYRQRPLIGSTYSKDEIMAMPTIILVPATGASKVTANNAFDGLAKAVTQPATLSTDLIMSSSTTQSVTSLVVDVSSTNTSTSNNPKTDNMPDSRKESVTVKMLDTVKNASVPKENSVTNATETGTPQMLPLVRKSSSTPRRTSHVRVLDFTTPRRIFYETMKGGLSKHNDSADEVIVSGSSNINLQDLENNDKSEASHKNVNNETVSTATKENNATNKLTVNKSNNWDADLRALIAADMNRDNSESDSKSKAKSKSKKKIRDSICTVNSREKEKTGEKKPNVKKKSPKNKRSKKKEQMEKIIEPLKVEKEEPADFPIKPTINIITGNDWNTASSTLEGEKSQSKHNSEEHIDTPETEKNYLQNAIGAKLNISDLLETPYKQVLYDIQMETPKFLGPDIPEEPISDIKIMSIPTPRFLNTPKLVQATPSSYSSRPTDYSSGGSYYKPDDQDYIPITEDLVSCTENIKTNDDESFKIIDDGKEKINLKSRPVRQCTKNVSYYSSPYINNKTKEVEEKIEIVSSSSDSINSSTEKQSDKVLNTKPSKDKCKTQLYTEIKKKSNSKKRKSPIRKESSKTFMKIKPRKTTPIKEVIGKSKKKLADLSQNHLLKTQTRKRTTSKEKTISTTPVVVSLPSKSRRKSSTPRKLHCTKMFNSENSDHNSPETNDCKIKGSGPLDSNIISNAQNSDTEQLPLRWSDESSQDVKLDERHVSTSDDIDEISKIREYIQTTVSNNPNRKIIEEGSLHIDLIKRGFDIETAKIIERDLLDTPLHMKPIQISVIEGNTANNKNVGIHSVISSKLNVPHDVIDEDEIELSVYECAQEGESYIVTHHDYTKDLTTTTTEHTKLKDTYNMEICIDDGAPIRLRLSPFKMLFEQEPFSWKASGTSGKQDETKLKSDSIKIHMPGDNSLKVQYSGITDSTAANTETSSKINSLKKRDQEITTTTTEIVLEVEQINVKGKPEIKKRKRLQSGNVSDDTIENKRVKSEAQYLFSSAHMQNIDIESVLSKLHGP